MTRLDPLEVDTIAADVLEGKANPHDVRRLLDMFCYLVDRDMLVPRGLLLYLRDSIKRCRSNEWHRMESAFGLKRRKGRPNVSEERQKQLATEVLRLRLSGTRHQDALVEVAERYGHPVSVIGEAYGERRLSAVIMLRDQGCSTLYTTDLIG
jgi:hypothetical protein